MPPFKLHSDFKPTGDQPEAIEGLVKGLEEGARRQTLLGVTGSGKTFTMANIVERVQMPTLVLAPNRTLAAQLWSEFREFFPSNAVEYFVSYYDYYQPEAYIPRTDTYIAKDADINDEIDKLRHAATRALFERQDVLIVASISCIYGLGEPEEYQSFVVRFRKGERADFTRHLRRLVDMQYERNDVNPTRGRFRLRGDSITVHPSYEELAVRIDFFGDEVERILEIDPLTGEIVAEKDEVAIYPAKHFVTSKEKLTAAIEDIREELEERVAYLREEGKILEASRLEERTRYDIETMIETGYCSGIENYSRHLARRPPGSTPWNLLDYFPDDWLMFVDESHISIPQARGMYHGDVARKTTLVDYGFRLPSALDNRPLNFTEFEQRQDRVIYVSATPGPYELEISEKVVEQIIRPTGLVDPRVELRPAAGQVDDLLGEIQARVAAGERVLVTTLTKRMAEELTDYYGEAGVRVRYLHSDIQTIERMEIIRELREGAFDVLVGINLLREGLDIPEVSLVAVLDADKEGFLRSARSLIQTIGRAARNVNGTVILYADQQTDSIRRTVEETERRRATQERYNAAHGITPQSVKKRISSLRESIWEQDYVTVPTVRERPAAELPAHELPQLLAGLRREMQAAAKELDFERAAELRDRIRALEDERIARG